MRGNKLSAECVHFSRFKNRINNDLVLTVYTYMRTYGLSIRQRLPCAQPSELLCGWQSG